MEMWCDTVGFEISRDLAISTDDSGVFAVSEAIANLVVSPSAFMMRAKSISGSSRTETLEVCEKSREISGSK